MGGVRARMIAPPGVAPITSFQDTFVRVDQPFFVGDDWFLQITQDTGISGSAFATLLNVTANKLVVGGAGNFNTANAMLIPATINVPVVRQRGIVHGLFSQMQVVGSVAGVDCSCGPSVFLEPNKNVNYALSINTNPQTVSLYANTANAPRILLDPVFNWAVNDVVRIEALIGVGSNTINCYQNGVLIATVVDNDATRPTGGLFGFTYYGSFTGSLQFNNYSGGVL